jgi:uncharacterized protein
MIQVSNSALSELDDFLMSDRVEPEAMDLTELDGYLTAIVSCPTMLLPSQWLTYIWGPDDVYAPEFNSNAEAERILGLIFARMNDIIACLRNPDQKLPQLFDAESVPNEEYLYDLETWALGFCCGMRLASDDWKSLSDTEDGKKWLMPILALGSEVPSDEEYLLTCTQERRMAFAQQIPEAVQKIYNFFEPQRSKGLLPGESFSQNRVPLKIQPREEIKQPFFRDVPKIGRNDPCPCGSGKKYKHCCAFNMH